VHLVILSNSPRGVCLPSSPIISGILCFRSWNVSAVVCTHYTTPSMCRHRPDGGLCTARDAEFGSTQGVATRAPPPAFWRSYRGWTRYFAQAHVGQSITATGARTARRHSQAPSAHGHALSPACFAVDRRTNLVYNHDCRPVAHVGTERQDHLPDVQAWGQGAVRSIPFQRE
jgi:hypothetical protein